MSRPWLVTGGAGFIGSHLVEALLARGDGVLVLDDASTGDFANLAAVRDHPQLELVHGSVCDDLVVDELARRSRGIVHLAASVGVRRILDQRVRGIVTNLRGTEVVLRAAETHGRQPVLLASSSEVYGKGHHAPFREGDDCVLGPSGLHRWSYACAKLMDEFLALAYQTERGLPVRIVRFFNVTGPRQSPAYGMVLPRFCCAALAGEPLLVHGDGGQSRTFLHVVDAVAALLALLDCPAADGTVCNVGGEEEIAIEGLARRVVARAGSDSEIHLLPYDQAFPDGGFEDMRRRVPDTARVRSLTGWSPVRSLDDIIADALGLRHPPQTTLETSP